MSYQKIEGQFLSTDQLHSIPYYICKPIGRSPKGIVQILHGLNENASCYEDNGLAYALTQSGYVVCASDHLGHGGAVSDSSEHGDFASVDGLIEDARLLRGILRQTYRHLPYFMLGHDLGSCLLREYLKNYPDELDGVILTGTIAGRFKFGTEKTIAKLFTMLGMGKKPAGNIYKKLQACIGLHASHDDFPLTYRAYSEVLSLYSAVNTEEYLADTPRSVPILLLSGEDDPMSEGMASLHEQLFDAGVDDLNMILYPNRKHGILNSTDNDGVITDIIAWLDDECEHYQNDKIWHPLG